MYGIFIFLQIWSFLFVIGIPRTKLLISEMQPETDPYLTVNAFRRKELNIHAGGNQYFSRQ